MCHMDREVLTKQVAEKRHAVDQLRNELTALNEQKEHWFQKKEELNEKIASLISDIKKNKNARDECSAIVKEHKKLRDELNAKLHSGIEELKKCNSEKADVLAKRDFKGDPSIIKREIQRLEQTIETNVMSFDKEKQLMKRINELRKQYKECEQTSGLFDQAAKLGKEVDEYRAKANEAHRLMQAKAKESQEKHLLILTVSKQIDELRKEEQDAFAKFLEFKTKFADINEKIKTELTELNTLYGELGERKEEQREQRQRKIEQQLEKMEGKVEEKLKQGKKLTMEDILVFQQQAELEDKKK